MLPDLTRLRVDYHVYPGQPLVSAACIVQLYQKIEDAAAKTPQDRKSVV